jgi:hypothetical protein
VARLQQDFRGGQSNIGGIATIVERELPDDGSLDFIASRAISGGVSFEHSWADQEWLLWGNLSATHVQGSTTAITRLQRSSRHFFQRPDQTYLRFDPTRTSLSGFDWRLQFERPNSEHWTGAVWLAERAPGYEPNDIGFSNATERLDGGARLEYEERTPGPVLRSYNIEASTFHNFRHSVLDDFFSTDAWGQAHKAGNVSLDVNASFLNYWSIAGGYTFRPTMLSDTLTRGGPLMVNPGEHEIELGFDSDARKLIAFGVEGEYRDNLRGGHSMAARFSLNARPTNGLTLNLEFEYEKILDRRQFVTSVADPSFTPTYGGRYFFADLYRDEFSVEAGIDWILSPVLSIRAYFQPLISSGDFRTYKQLALASSFDFREFQEGNAIAAGGTTTCAGGDLCRSGSRIFLDYSGDGVADTSFREQNFSVSSLLGNVVVRWEYSPGSQIFFVWQQNRETRTSLGRFDVWRDARAIFEADGEHVFMIKATRWFSL